MHPTFHLLLCVVLLSCATVPPEQAALIDQQPTLAAAQAFTDGLPLPPPAIAPPTIPLASNNKPYVEGYGFKVFRQKFTPNDVLMLRNQGLPVDERMSHDVIAFPGDGVDGIERRMLGAPTQLKCLKNGKQPSFDCRIIDIIKVDGEIYFVAQYQLYRYRPDRTCEDRLEYVGSYNNMLTTLNDKGAILAVSVLDAAGLLYTFDGTWRYQQLAKPIRDVKQIVRKREDLVELRRSGKKPLRVTLGPAPRGKSFLASNAEP